MQAVHGMEAAHGMVFAGVWDGFDLVRNTWNSCDFWLGSF